MPVASVDILFAFRRVNVLLWLSGCRVPRFMASSVAVFWIEGKSAVEKGCISGTGGRCRFILCILGTFQLTPPHL